MSAIRCKECSFVAKQNDGFCPECGAMYVEPHEYVSESEMSAPRRAQAPKPDKKKGGLFASLFGGKEETPTTHHTSSGNSASSMREVHSSNLDELLQNHSRDEIKMRCRECNHLDSLGENFCSSCGAFFVDPHDYVTNESLAVEQAEAQKSAVERFHKIEKTYDEMSDKEKLGHLKENIADIWDQIIKDRYALNEKANECMQCFTAAGTIKSENETEVLGSTIKQRYHNMKDFEMLFTEYKRQLEAFSVEYENLIKAQQAYAQFEQQIKQPSA